MGGLVMILARSSLFSSLGVVMVLMVFKVSLVEAKIEARCGICILSTFSSGLQGRIFVFVFVYFCICICVFLYLFSRHLETGDTGSQASAMVSMSESPRGGE